MQHVVRAWEFLAAIASQHGTTVRAILAANPQITDPELVFPDQVIALPVDGEPGPAATYLVRSGDTMGKIARTFDVATAALIAANPQVPDPNRIRPGQVLNLPAGARRSDDVASATDTGWWRGWPSLVARWTPRSTRSRAPTTTSGSSSTTPPRRCPPATPAGTRRRGARRSSTRA